MSTYTGAQSLHLCAQFDAILTLCIPDQLESLNICLLVQHVEGSCVPVQAGQIYRFSNIYAR